MQTQARILSSAPTHVPACMDSVFTLTHTHIYSHNIRVFREHCVSLMNVLAVADMYTEI